MKRYLTLFLVGCIIASLICVALAVPASAVTHVLDRGVDGLSVSGYSENSKGYGSDYYEAEKRLAEVPHTFEAWVYLSSSMRRATVGSIIASSGKGGNSFSFGINKYFYPQLILNSSSGTNSKPTVNVVFDQSEISPAGWTHVVITLDDIKGELSCYLNGEYKQTVSNVDLSFFTPYVAARYPFRLGGTNQPMNPDYFRGYMQDVAMYSDILTPDEIKGSYKNGVNVFDENLICYYDLDASDMDKDIKDLSGNGYDLSYSKLWLTEEEMQELRDKKNFGDEYEYSIAVIGDIQYTTKSFSSKLPVMYQWIVDNMESKNIKYSIGLGDITDQCQEAEWQTAYNAFKIMENAGLEYSLVRGNHDVAYRDGVAVGGMDHANYGATAVPERFDELFYGNDFYRSQFEEHGGFYEEGSVINTYRRLYIEGDSWLIVNIDFQADKDVRDWANEVIENHPDYRVIIVTHEYVTGHGKLSSYGNTLWNEVASRHANVELVLGGHVTYDSINVYQTKGIHGNTVTQMLIDAQYMDREFRGLGVVTMFYFREDGTVVDVEHYSTIKNRYLMNKNQFSVDLRADCDPPESVWDGTTFKAPEGDGTKENPYKISKASHLLWMAETLLVTDGDGVILPTTLVNAFEGKYFVQTSDIDLYAKTIPSIGYYFESEEIGSVFGGNYDGGGYTIRNGRIVNPYNNTESVGLFGETLGASISNLTLKEITVETSENSAFLVGRANGDDVIDSCNIDDSCRFVIGDSENEIANVGTLVGTADGAYIANCESKASITLKAPDAKVGALIGSAADSVIYNSSAYGDVTVDTDFLGAAAGELSGTVTVIGFKNKTNAEDYILSSESHVHTATSYVKADSSSHSTECECGAVIVLPCVKNAHGYCKYCEFSITGASITLGSEISLNYYVNIADKTVTEGKTLSMQFVMNGKTVVVKSHSEKNGKLVFKLGGILPHQIGELVDARLVVSDGKDSAVIDSKLGYSVRENCLSLIRESDDEKLVSLINSLLDYATRAQAYLDYNTDRFVGGGINLPMPEAERNDDERTSVLGNKNADCNIIKAYATLDDNLAIKLDMYVKDISALVITVNNESYDITKLISHGDGKYTLLIDGFMPKDICGEFDVSVLYNGKQAARVKIGVLSHLYSMIADKWQIEDDKAHYRPVTKSVDPIEYQLFQAIYRYATAALEYYNAVTEVSK